MRPVLLALMFSGSVFALSGTAYAQTSPDTRQTDQSEEDWRKSQKKGGTSSEDILDIIKNTRSSGVGNGRGYSPIDALPEESRRHLMKERARRMAQAGPNEPVDVSYTPSEAAKSDSNLEADEKAAWEKMAQAMNGAPDQGLQGQGQGGQNGQGQQGQQSGGSGSQGQQGQGQQGSQGQQGQQGQQQGSGQSRSVMRGGSANSVADIMNRIKGLGQGGSGTGQGQGQAPQGQSGQGSQGQSSQGQSSQQGQSQQGQSQSAQTQQGQQGQSQSQAQAQNQGQNQSQSQQEGQQQSDSQSDAQAQAQAQAEADAKAASQAQASAQNQDASRVPEAISPLDRIKQANREQSTTGTRSSASDYLKKKE